MTLGLPSGGPGWETLMGLPGEIGPAAEKRYLEAVWKELFRVDRMLNFYKYKFHVIRCQ